MNLADQLRTILPELLPKSPDEAILGPELLERVRPIPRGRPCRRIV
jgi:hypothetical protein